MFARQHYEKVAELLKKERASTKDVNAQVALANVTVRFADAFETDNPRFQRGRFYRAAGFYEKGGDQTESA